MEPVRCFIAIELPGEVRAALAGLQQALRGRAAPGVRWVEASGIHLTLKFLGDVPQGHLPRVVAAIREASQGEVAFWLHLGGLGFFPDSRRPRVFWVSLEGEVDRVRRLAQRLEQALAAEGFPRERRPFAPHLTLARLGERMSPQERTALAQAALDFPWPGGHPFPVRAISLMRSRLTPQGAIYSRLEAVGLGAGT